VTGFRRFFTVPESVFLRTVRFYKTGAGFSKAELASWETRKARPFFLLKKHFFALKRLSFSSFQTAGFFSKKDSAGLVKFY
jgi:hypothetical protein